MSSENRRRQIRVETEFSVRFSDAKGTFIEECVANLSKSGVFIETLKPRNLKEIIELFIRIPGSADEITVQGEVAHVIQEPEADAAKAANPGKRFGMGVRFITVEPKQKTLLKEFIEKALVSRGAGSRLNARIYDYKKIKVRPKNVHEFKTRFMPNMSCGGLFFETNEEITLFDLVDLVLTLPTGGEEIHLASEVVHIRNRVVAGKNTLQGVGVKFIKMNDEKRAAIERYVRELLSQE